MFKKEVNMKNILENPVYKTMSKCFNLETFIKVSEVNAKFKQLFTLIQSMIKGFIKVYILNSRLNFI